MSVKGLKNAENIVNSFKMFKRTPPKTHTGPFVMDHWDVEKVVFLLWPSSGRFGPRPFDKEETVPQCKLTNLMLYTDNQRHTHVFQ